MIPSSANNKSSGFLKNEYFQACVILLVILNVFFLPVIWGNKTLMAGARDAPSILPGGAYGDINPPRRFHRTPDPGAPAWHYEPLVKIIQNQYLNERNVPLWNPYSAFGTPLAADMISQPFYPLSILLSLCPTAQTYDLFIILRLFLAGIFAYLFLRLFINKTPALFGSITFMFTGYFILYLNMPHLSVEVLLPAVFYCFELLLRRSDFKRIVCAALIVFLTISGGMPESTFLILSFGYLYYLFRLFTDPSIRNEKWLHIKNFIWLNVLGFALSAVLLLPFLEFMKYSYDVHQPSNLGGVIRGIDHDSGFKSFLVYLIPMIFGGALNSVFPERTGITGYWGVLSFLLAIFSVIAFFRSKKNFCFNATASIVIFFSCAAALMIMKRFGSVLVNWIGCLPLSNMIYYPKYQEPLLGFAVAVLSGIGLSALGEKLKQKHFLTAIAVTAGIIIVFIMCWIPTIAVIKYKSFTFLNIAAAFFLLSSITILYLISRRSVKVRSRLQLIFIFMLTAELFCNFILPSFYSLNNLPDQNADPYKGAPYIDYLKENNDGYFRVFGRENVLYPNWSGVFGLSDVRQLNAMSFAKYFVFVRNFFAEESDDQKPYGAPFTDRFTGSEKDYFFNTLTESRFLQLSSVKYLLSISPYELPPRNQGLSGETPDQFKKVYDNEIKIYEVSDILPRTSVYFQAELIDQDNYVLSRLKDPSLDIRQCILIDSSDLNSREKELVNSINNFSPRMAQATEISSYESRKVVLKTELSQPGILMLNDTWYPGWKAYVNGREVKILKANYLFRGVLLEEGQHTVEFRYEPLSLRLGRLISATSLIVTVALFLKKTTRQVCKQSD